MEDSTFTEKLPLPRHLSPSRALDFRQCPLMFYYKAIEKRRDASTIATAKGTLVHAGLENIFDLPAQDRTPEALTRLILEYWEDMRSEKDYAHLFVDQLDSENPELSDEERETARIEEKEFIAAAVAVGGKWFEIEDPKRFEPDKREMWLKVTVKGVPAIGVLDRSSEINGRRYISDYKTGKTPQPRYQDKAFFGLRIYAALFREITGQTPDELRLIYVAKPTVLKQPCNDQVCDRAVAELVSLWRSIKRAWSTEVWPTKTGPLCPWCSFQEICPEWAPAQSETVTSVDDDKNL